MPDENRKARDGGDSPFSDVPIEIIVSVGRAKPRIRDLLSLQPDDVVPLDRKISDPVEIYVGDKLIARGELQETEGDPAGQLAVRLTEIVARRGA